MSNELLYMLGGSVRGAGEPAAEGVSFDGVNDYLSRSSDLVGNTDSKTFTFSCWVYRSTTTELTSLCQSHGLSYGFYASLSPSGQFKIECKTTNEITNILTVQTFANAVPLHTYAHILCSVDLSNTSNRWLFINDKEYSPSWSVYSNDVINMTTDSWYVHSYNNSPLGGRNRMSHLFLDYNYRDLSIEANRRLFITAEGKPA